jgi:hypothetical protein
MPPTDKLYNSLREQIRQTAATAKKGGASGLLARMSIRLSGSDCPDQVVRAGETVYNLKQQRKSTLPHKVDFLLD